MVRRFDVYLVSLDPVKGRELKKTRPCVIISPNEMHALDTIIIAPMTTKSKHHFTLRVVVNFSGQSGYIVLDQIRTIDKCRLIKHLGKINHQKEQQVLSILQEMFAP